MKKLSRRSVMEAVRREGAAVVTNHHPPQLPELARLQASDNSITAVLGQPMPNPRLLLPMERSRIT
ncbi:hypothetical protein [Denitratimonas tolerans]|jgi:hypothetical protein|uniref:Uncharacterized protein n=1 Tax=Denitratimonas tolerans TaxID=1338420 RepID=A0AAW9R4V1_9GAMM